MQLLHGPPLLARLPGLCLQPASQLLGKGVKLALPVWRHEFWRDGVRRQMLGHGIPRHACQPRDLADRQLLPQMHPSDDVQKSHVDHSVAPAALRFGGRFIWLTPFGASFAALNRMRRENSVPHCFLTLHTPQIDQDPRPIPDRGGGHQADRSRRPQRRERRSGSSGNGLQRASNSISCSRNASMRDHG